MKVTFLRHRDTPQFIEDNLKRVLIDLIENKGATTFYVGNNGNFDILVRKTLKSLEIKYSQINYNVVLAYMPFKKVSQNSEDFSDTIFPEILANTPSKYAITKCNNWMIEQSDIVVVYVNTPVGGAAKFKEKAIKKGKFLINTVHRVPTLN